MSTVTDPILLDRTGQDISARLQKIADAINGGTIDPLTVTVNGVYTPSAPTIGYGPVTVDVPTGIPVITAAQWAALTTDQKLAYGLVVIQDSDSGFHRGELVYGADYAGVALLQSGTARDSVTVNTTYSGHYKLFVLAVNSEARSYSLAIAASINGTPLTPEISEYNDYSVSGNNRRNYRMNVYDLQSDANDTLNITLATNNNYSSFVFGIIDSTDWDFSKALTTPDAATSGENSASGMAVYGTFSGGSGGTINAAAYTANAVISTDNPGTSYRSSYIFWFS